MGTAWYFSEILGWTSIICWIVVFTPQLFENYKRKSGESLSVLFLFIWLLGDILALVGLILCNLEIFQIVLTAYYTIVDSLLILQIYYYRRYRETEEVRILDGSATENEPLLHSRNDDVESSAVAAQKRFNSAFLNPLYVVYLLSLFTSVMAGSDSSDGMDHLPEYAKYIAYFCGYASAVLYIGSRIPQIYKNYQLKSCEGLSVWLFILSVIGNLTYVFSIFARYVDQDYSQSYITTQLPYLIGSGGTLIFDFTIFTQFFYYRKIEIAGYEKI